MPKLMRKRAFVPMALAAAASAVALAASPASAAPFTKINISGSAIPSGADCVYLTNTTAAWTSASYSFRAGANVSITDKVINANDNVVFEWHNNDCGPNSQIKNDFRQAPDAGGDVWNVN